MIDARGTQRFYGPSGGKTGLDWFLLGSRTRRARQEKWSPTRTQKTTLRFSCRYETSSITPQPPQTHLGLPQKPSSHFGKKKGYGWNPKNSAFTQEGLWYTKKDLTNNHQNFTKYTFRRLKKIPQIVTVTIEFEHEIWEIVKSQCEL